VTNGNPGTIDCERVEFCKNDKSLFIYSGLFIVPTELVVGIRSKPRVPVGHPGLGSVRACGTLKHLQISLKRTIIFLSLTLNSFYHFANKIDDLLSFFKIKAVFKNAYFYKNR
jgi:hypothetical protein